MNTKSISRISGVLYVTTVLAFLVSNLFLKEQLVFYKSKGIPRILAGERIRGCVVFGKANETVAAWKVEVWEQDRRDCRGR